MFTARILKTGLAIVAISGAVAVWSAPVQAGESTGTWRNGMVAGPYGPGYYGPDGPYYGDGRQQRRRSYSREYYRPSRNYGTYYEYRDPYARPSGYRWRGGYGYRSDPYWDDGGW
jgi:hypothetical protein